MSKASRRKFTSEFKSKVCLQAVKEQQTIEALSKKYDLHPTHINTWKKVFADKAPALFGKAGIAAADDSDKDQLIQLRYAQIEELKVANDFLEKSCRKATGRAPGHHRQSDEQLRVVKRCELLQLSRSGLYYEPVKESTENLTVMRFLDE